MRYLFILSLILLFAFYIIVQQQRKTTTNIGVVILAPADTNKSNVQLTIQTPVNSNQSSYSVNDIKIDMTTKELNEQYQPANEIQKLPNGKEKWLYDSLTVYIVDNKVYAIVRKK